ncbi:dihydrolipoyl dehydrogenase [Neopusillimonas maritima]|jgi:dihydrolipoamide dehydrogenase|uniref:Dihydrolipoyl dehydrogenase n=1 Tax=Neopusillimonas maritima TaxID=2026239 RepID=A0ABX9MT82_9BURK|nr:dihydrolipoyl dehydrogenase [Neopusillimonas maritima]RII82154.1 dihydrolipoyl dehydrogenase [Neopusillimonas maritima]|tara:strand:- start:3065 stop:4483 length:1419 start_codon:yes stop_codon:yes gene_type:complete
MKHLNTDIAVIGAGTAGMSAYRTVKASGLACLLIEGGPYGTTCARVGCMPSKLLIAAAEAAHHARHTAEFGVHVQGEVQVNGREVMSRVRRERDRFVGFVLEAVQGFDPADRLQGSARFLSNTELQVGNHTRVTASRIIIATGSSPVIPPMYQGLGDRLVVNDDVFNWEKLPESVLVVGPGVIGMELGQALSRLGVRVQLLGRSPSVGGIADPRVLESALAAFHDELDLAPCAEVHSVEKQTHGVRVCFTPEGGARREATYEYVLMAVGRSPNFDALELANTSAHFNDQNKPVFDTDTLQVKNTPIFLAGDVNGQMPLLHEAADDGRFAALNAVHYPQVEAFKRRAPVSVVFTDPQLMWVGRRFNQLDPAETVVGEVSFANQGRARVILKNKGLLRVYADRCSGQFLGAEMAGPAAEHLAHLLAWSHQQKLTIRQMLAMPFYHPVIEEGLRTALRDADGQVCCDPADPSVGG